MVEGGGVHSTEAVEVVLKRRIVSMPSLHGRHEYREKQEQKTYYDIIRGVRLRGAEERPSVLMDHRPLRLLLVEVRLNTHRLTKER